jgi:polyisoprenoid-binding protein YceI/mono/diheme cytochrome c family protein
MKTLRLYLIVLGVLLLLGLGITVLGPSKPVVAEAPLETVAAPPAAPVLEVSGPSQQLYKIDASQSEASYSVDEIILQTIEGRTVVGKSKGISGELLFDTATPGNSQLGKITIDVEGLTSDSTLRDERIRKGFLESSKYPEATFIPEKLVGLPEKLESNQNYSFQIEGYLTAKKTTAKTTWDATLTLQDNKLIGSASTTIYMSIFGVGPINIAGLLQTKDEMKLSINFVAVPETTPLAQIQQNTETFQVVGKQDNAPEFFADIKPILEQNCVACHSTGQIGHGVYPLDTARDAVTKAEDIALATSTKYMPPWPPSENSVPLKHARTITKEEIALITNWANAGAPVEGSLETPLISAPKNEGVTLRKDMDVMMENPYISRATGSDDYRCFLIDPKLTQDTYITGYEFLPGNLKINHHIILFLIPGDSRAKADELAARDGDDGWSCFGDAGIKKAFPTAISWTPGEVPIRYSEGTGIFLPKGTLFVLQVHYNLSAGIEPDQSGVGLELSTEKLNPVMGADMFAPVELPCPVGDNSESCKRSHALADLKAQEPDTEPGETNDGMLAMCGKTLADYARQDVSNIVSSCDYKSAVDGEIVTLYAHMHTLGKSFQLILNPDTPQEQTLLKIPHWSFSWQGTYTIDNPVQLKKGDKLRVICTFDNAPKIASVSPQETQPLESLASALGLARAHENILQGKSRYIIWGEGTKEEMCIGSIGVLPTAQYINAKSVIDYPEDNDVAVQVLWLRLQRQFIWLIPLATVVVAGAGLLVWRARQRTTPKQ